MVIDGKKIADEIISKLKQQPKSQKFFGAFLVGDDPASISFLKQKERIAKELGVDFRLYRSSTSIVNDELRREVLKTAKARTCGGIIMQLPLPKHLNKHYVIGERALGAFYTGRNPVLPPAVGVVEKILRIMNYESGIKTMKAAVIGRGLLVGKPVAIWLMDKVAELSVFASTTKDLRNKLKDADIIISGVGKAGLFGPEDVKKDALIIDFGYNMVSGKISGDFESDVKGSADAKALADRQMSDVSYTPTPGGTGPILVAKLFENFYKLTTR